MCSKVSSVAAVATRVSARTFEYDSRPSPKASAIFGSDAKARAVRTFSRAATRPMPHCQFSHWAQLAQTVAGPAFAAVELRNEGQKMRGGRVDVSPHRTETTTPSPQSHL